MADNLIFNAQYTLIGLDYLLNSWKGFQVGILDKFDNTWYSNQSYNQKTVNASFINILVINRVPIFSKIKITLTLT